MNRLVKILLLLVTGMLLAAQTNAYSKSYHYSSNSDGQRIIRSERHFSSFSAIDADGPFQIILSNGSPQKVSFVGSVLAMEKLSATVQNHTLVLRVLPYRRTSEPYNPKILVRITMPATLRNLVLAGDTHLRSSGVRTSALTIYTRDQASVSIKGVVNLQKIEGNSSGGVNLGWINSRSVVIGSSGSGKIILSGYAPVLTAHLAGNACLEAEFLRTRDVYVETRDTAIARVLPVNSLYAFACNFSNIYYFKTPRQIVRDSRGSGNILQVESWN